MTETWTPNPDGEHNEEVATVNGHTLHVASDNFCADWLYWIDDGPCVYDIPSLDRAKLAALEEVADMRKARP